MEINKKLNWGEITTRIEENGWKHKDIGTYKTKNNGNNVISQIEGFNLFVRERDFDEFLKNSSFSNLENPLKSRVSGWGSKAEYSCAAEPPVRGGVSHLSRRNEPL